MNNLDIVLALFTRLNHRFSRLDATAAFQADTTAAFQAATTTSTCNFNFWIQQNSSQT